MGKYYYIGDIKEYNFFGRLVFDLNGERSGKGKEYDYNGKLIFEGEYLYGHKIKGKEYIDGKLEYEGEFLFDKKYNGKGYDKNANFSYELINGCCKIKEKSIKSTKNHAINLNSKNFVNNRSHIYQSDKGNKSKMIYKNYNCIGINSAKNDGNQNILIQKENTKNENLNTGRLLRRYKIIKGKEEDKRNNNVLKNQDISKLNNKNNKDSNPFRDNDNNNYYCSKKLNKKREHKSRRKRA